MKKLYLLSLLIFTVLSLAQADIPKTIHFQGRLTDLSGNPVADGNPSITFRLWDAETSGTMLWTGTYDAPTKEGYYSVELGSGLYPFTGLTFNQPYFLDLKVGSDPNYLSPRIKLDSAAYALNVADGAISTAKLVDSSVVTAKISDSAITTAKIQDNAVTTAKINNGAVTTDKIANNATSNKWIKEDSTSRIWASTGSQLITSLSINLSKDTNVIVFASCNIASETNNPTVLAQFSVTVDGMGDEIAETSIDPSTPSDHVTLLATGFLTAGTHAINFYVNPITISPSGATFRTNRHKIYAIALYK